MNKTKTLKMKLIYIVAAVAMLAMLIPAMALPVSAQDAEIVLTTLGDDYDGGYDIAGMHVIATLYVDDVETEADWALNEDAGDGAGASFVGEHIGVSSVEVRGSAGQTSIEATYEGATEPVTKTKKWADIDHTEFSVENGTTTVSWNETAKCYYAEAQISDTVKGNFPLNANHGVQGVILNWYLFNQSADLSMVKTDEAQDLVDYLDTHGPRAQFVEFVDSSVPGYQPDDVTPPYEGWLGTQIKTVTDASGTCSVELAAWDKESVVIVVIPQYPNDLQKVVVPEITTWNFDKEEYSIVPQVRWIGEKIVLERNFSPMLAGTPVNFAITTNSDQAVLINYNPTAVGMNLTSNSRSVWTVIDEFGLASVILTCDTPDEVIVDCTLYDYPSTNARFRVFFLKFETINLSDVDGKRANHNDGVWTQEDEIYEYTYYNPYNKYFPEPATGLQSDTLIPPYPLDDILEQDRNVSEDALERVQVRGWFEGVNMSTRPKAYQDNELADRVFSFDGPFPPVVDLGYDVDFTLPEGRWVLPDDWVTLAGGLTKWTYNRLQWDIMDNPFDLVYAPDEDGPYNNGSIDPVIGPFSPGLEIMTPAGWNLVTITSVDPYRQIKTVVPNDELEAWDAPMPPAKILFEIIPEDSSEYKSVGFFKETDKGDVYIDFINGEWVYTNPFYSTLIPAHWAIPAFGGDGAGSYDWDSFETNAEWTWDAVNGEWDWVAPGPYEFWTILNRLNDPITSTSDPALHPTAVEVYSDNHGEAMAWLNGDWNLMMLEKGFVAGDDGVDLYQDSLVGTTVVRATADYPYVRSEPQITSNTVTKDWYWGGLVLGVDSRGQGSPAVNPFADENNPYSDASHNILSVGTFTNVTHPGGQETWEDDDVGTSDKHFAFIWMCDRDGKMEGAIGTKVTWWLDNGKFAETSGGFISSFNEITQNIFTDDEGFLAGTTDMPGSGLVDVETRTNGISYMREPTDWEKDLFDKSVVSGAFPNDQWGNELCADNFAVAGIEVYSSQQDDITVDVWLEGSDFGYTGRPIGQVYYTINIPLYDGGVKVCYPLDDPIIPGDANLDGVIDAADITAVERIILNIDQAHINGDTNSNGSIDMGDVVKIIRILRGDD